MSTEQNSLSKQDIQILEEAEKLIWALLDEQINEVDAKELELLIQDNKDVRQRYLQCAQVHSDLYSHYRNGPAKAPSDEKLAPSAEARPQSPVLGTLLGDLTLPQSGPSSLTE